MRENHDLCQSAGPGCADPIGRLIGGLLQVASVKRVETCRLTPLEGDVIEATMLRADQVVWQLRLPGAIGGELSRRLRLLTRVDPWGDAPVGGVLRSPYAMGGVFTVSFIPFELGEQITLARREDEDL